MKIPLTRTLSTQVSDLAGVLKIFDVDEAGQLAELIAAGVALRLHGCVSRNLDGTHTLKHIWIVPTAATVEKRSLPGGSSQPTAWGPARLFVGGSRDGRRIVSELEQIVFPVRRYGANGLRLGPIEDPRCETEVYQCLRIAQHGSDAAPLVVYALAGMDALDVLRHLIAHYQTRTTSDPKSAEGPG